MTNTTLMGNPHLSLDAGNVVSAKPKRGFLSCRVVCLVLAVAFVCGLPALASGVTYYVATNGSDASTTPTDPTTPLASLAEAYSRAADGDEVVIAAGTYTPADTLTVAKGITFRSATGNPEDVKIDGADARRPIILNHAQAQLRDLVVMRGKSDGTSYTLGSNVRINANGGTVSNCVIRGGKYATYATRASGGGAGISCASASGLIVNCVITNNTVSGNTGWQQGGGLYMTAGTAVGCYIAKNFATLGTGSGVYGGGVHVQGTAKVVNCTIVGNKSPNGGGVDAYSSTAKVVNCLIWDNEGDGDADVYTGKADCFQNCIARYAINDTCLAPGTSATKAPFSTPTPAYAGLDKSVAVDGVTLPSKDVLGKTRVVNGIADIGCVEYQAAAPEVAFSVSSSSGFAPLSVTFTAAASGVSGITAYNWDFDGDGTVDETTAAPTVTHSYATAGFFTPSLSVACTGGPLTYAVPTGAVKAYPKTMYVNSQNANPKLPYASKGDAAKTLADALAVASDGQTIILLAAGSPYNISKTLDVTKGVTVRGETGDPEDVIIRRNSGAIKLMRVSHEQALVHSLVLQGGAATDYGVGVKIDSTGGTVSNCIVRSCEVQGYWSSSAVHATGAKALVTHCVITNNSSNTSSAGTDKTVGLHLASGAVANNCLIANNHEKATSGTCCTAGVYAPNGYLYNCTVADNSARRTGGIRIDAGGVYNCVFAGNVSTTKGTAYNTLDNIAKASLFHNCASDDAAAINATCQIDGAASFFKNYATADYTVGAGSKLIDNGTTEAVTVEATDLAGLDRIIGRTVDIGCYEYDSSAFSGGFAVSLSEGLVPIDVAFIGSASGTNGTDVLRYHWDFDGDNVYDAVTDGPTVTNRYTAGARYTVNMKVENVTASKFTDPVSKPGVLSLATKTMYVVATANPNSLYPFDTWAKAASTVNAAVDEAQDGIEIILTNGTHQLPRQLVVARNIDIHGLTGRPEDVIAQFAGASDVEPAFKVSATSPRIRDITWESKANINRPGWILEGGGTLTNCVLRNFNNYTYWASCGAVFAMARNSLVTHCVITNITQVYGGDGAKAIVRTYGGRIENCLIGWNSDTAGLPLVVAAGPFVNNTVVTNDLASGSIVMRDKYDTYAGGITNCLFAANTVNGVAGNVFSLQTANVCHNLSDSEVIWPAGTKNFIRPTADIFDAEAKTPWTISIEAINAGCRGIKVSTSAVDLAGRPRRFGGRLDIGCYQCQIDPGTILVVR